MAARRGTRARQAETAQAVGAADPTIEQVAGPPKRSGPTIEEKQQAFKRCYSAFLDIEAAKKEMQSANGFYRNELKEAAKNGISRKAIVEAIKLKNADPDEISKDFADLNEMMVIAGIPVAAKPVQLGLFADGESVATKIEKGNLQATKDAEDNIEQLKELGYRAGLEGKSSDANPHKDDEGSPEFLAWAGGHRDGQKENMAGLAGKGNGAAVSAASH